MPPTCGVELHELQVLAGQASPGHHGGAVAGAGVGGCAAEVGAPIAAGENRSAERLQHTCLLGAAPWAAPLVRLHRAALATATGA